jgi:hypothetical protein
MSRWGDVRGGNVKEMCNIVLLQYMVYNLDFEEGERSLVFFFLTPCCSSACKGECHHLQSSFFSVVEGKNNVFTLAVNRIQKWFLIV